MRSFKIAASHVPGCDVLPWESEEERIQRKFPEKERKFLQPYISKDQFSNKDVRCSSLDKEWGEILDPKSVFSRLGSSSCRINRDRLENDQYLPKVIPSDREERSNGSSGKKSERHSATRVKRNLSAGSTRCLNSRDKTVGRRSDRLRENFEKPRACKHRIREEEMRSRSNFQGDSLSKFEDQLSEKKTIWEVNKEANGFKSGSRIYGLARQGNLSWSNELYNLDHSNSPNTEKSHLAEQQASKTVTQDTTYLDHEENSNQSPVEIVCTGFQESFSKNPEENLLTDILGLSEEISDDFEDVRYNLHSTSGKPFKSECQTAIDYAGVEDLKYFENTLHKPAFSLSVNSNVAKWGDIDDDVDLPTTDVEEGEIVAESTVKEIHVKQEENKKMTYVAPYKRTRWSKSCIKTSLDSCETDTWKSRVQGYYSQKCSFYDAPSYSAAHGTERHRNSMCLKRTRQRDLDAKEGTLVECDAKYPMISTKYLVHRSAHVEAQLEKDRELPKESGSVRCAFGRPVLSENARERASRMLDVEFKNLEHDRTPKYPGKCSISNRGKENAQSEGSVFDAHGSNSDFSNPQSTSFNLEFKEKCSVKVSEEVETVSTHANIDPPLSSVEISKSSNVFTEVTDHMLNESYCKGNGKTNRRSRTQSVLGVDADSHLDHEQSMKKTVSPLQSNRAIKIPKFTEESSEHKASADASEGFHKAVMARKSFGGDFSHKFAVKQQMCVQKRPKEENAHRLSQRLRQINFGKNTLGYERYNELVPRHKRSKSDPQTPDIHQVCSKRSWDGQVSKWRRCLHFYDPPLEEDEELPEEIGVISSTGIDLEGNEEQANASIPDEDELVKENDLSIYGEWMDVGATGKESLQETDVVAMD